jgi:hypothetical protein
MHDQIRLAGACGIAIVGPYLDRRQIPSYLDGLLIPKIDSLVMISRYPGYLRSSGLKASKDTGEALKG